MSIKEEIEKTYRKFDKIFTNQLGKPLKEFQMSQIRDQFKVWISKENPLFLDVSQAEDGIRDVERSRGLGDVYKRQSLLIHTLN